MRLFRFNAENVSKQRESQGSGWKVRGVPFVQKMHHEENGKHKKQQSPQIKQNQIAEPHCEAEKEQSDALISISCSIIRLELERGWPSADSRLLIRRACVRAGTPLHFRMSYRAHPHSHAIKNLLYKVC